MSIFSYFYLVLFLSPYALRDKCHDIVDNFLCHDIVDNAFEQLCYDWNRYDECPSRIGGMYEKKQLNRNDNGLLINMGTPATRPIFISRLVARKRGSTSGWLAMPRTILTGTWIDPAVPSAAPNTRPGTSKKSSR